MKIKSSTINTVLVGGAILAAIAFGIAGLGGSSTTDSSTSQSTVQNDGVQIIEVTAKNGYRPGTITAKANTPGILRVKTNSTFDCSSSLSIPKLGFNKLLPLTGNTDITVPAQAPNTEIYATCSMGMYGFVIKFV